jgi:hypothetical protein
MLQSGSNSKQRERYYIKTTAYDYLCVSFVGDGVLNIGIDLPFDNMQAWKESRGN